MTIFDTIKNMVTHGLEYFGKFYGTYPGYVMDNNDPEGQGRLILKVPSTYGDNQYNYWAPSKGIFSGKGYGSQILPQIGDMVWVEFRMGDPRSPIWSHGYFAKDQKPEELRDPNMYWLKTPKGQLIIVDDTNERIIISNANNNRITIDERGISIITDKIYLGNYHDAQEKAVYGESLQQQLNIEKARVTAIIQGLTNSVPVAGDGGAAFKTGIVAAVSTAQAPDYSNILSDKVKLD